jgi:hypothetical protein
MAHIRQDSNIINPIDQKIVKVQFPQQINPTQGQQQPQRSTNKSKRGGSNVVAQLREAVNQKPQL